MNQGRNAVDSESRPLVTIVGGVNIDVRGRPAEELHAQYSNPGRIRLSPGGAARNVAENLARLSINVRLIGGVPDGPDGRWLITQTAQAGVDVRGLVPIAGRGNYYVAIADAGGIRWAISDMAAAEALSATDIGAQTESIRTAEVVVVDANLAPSMIRHVLDTAATRRICLLPVSPAKAGRMRPFLSRAALIVLSAAEAEALTGYSASTADEALEAGVRLQGRGDAVVVVTLGMQGIGWVGKEAFWLPAIPATVVDATGAGDAVAAVAIYSMLKGLEARAAAALARAAGALTVSVEGATHPGFSLEVLRGYE